MLDDSLFGTNSLSMARMMLVKVSIIPSSLIVGDDLRQCLWGNLLQEAGILNALSSARYGIPTLDKLIGRGLSEKLTYSNDIV